MKRKYFLWNSNNSKELPHPNDIRSQINLIYDVYISYPTNPRNYIKRLQYQIISHCFYYSELWGGM